MAKAFVKMDFADLEASLQRVLAPLRDELLGQAETLKEKLVAVAPVKSGRFRDGWEVGPIRVEAGTFKISGSVVNDVKYARFIKSDKVGEEGLSVRPRNPLTEARKIARKQARDMKPRIIAIISEGLDI